MSPDSLKNLIESFKFLPGIGSKTAERLAFSILDLDEEQAEKFIHTLNYKYNESYKRGYDRAISEVYGKDLDTQFRFFYRDRFEKEPTNLELYLFNKLDDNQKSDTINDLKKQF